MAVPVLGGGDTAPSLSITTERIEEFVPNLIAAGALILGGFVVAWIARWLSVRLARSWGRRIAAGASSILGGDIEARLQRAQLDEATLRLFGQAVFFLVFLVFLAAATETLELPVVSSWVLGLANYLPQVAAAAIVIVLGVLAGSFARIAVTQAASSAEVEFAAPLGSLAQIAIIAISGVVAVDQLGLEISFLVIAVSIALAAGLGGAALAFGLGAQTTVSNIVATHYLAQTYRVGQRVRVGDHEGRIAEMLPTAVILETGDGRVHVPAKEFSEQISTLVSDQAT